MPHTPRESIMHTWVSFEIKAISLVLLGPES